MDTCCHLMNGITLVGELCDGQDPSVSLAKWSLSFIAIDFFMAYTYSFDYEIMQLPDTGGIPCVLSNVTT